MNITTEERIGFAPAAYALIYATINGWLRGFYGNATRSIASAIVCVIVLANLWTIVRVLNRTLAFAVVASWRNTLFVVALLTCAVVDLAFVQTGKADRWALQAMTRWKLAAQYRSGICAVLIGITVTSFLWPLLA